MSELFQQIMQKVTTCKCHDSLSKDPNSAEVLNKGTLVTLLTLTLLVEEIGLLMRIRQLWSATY